MDLSKYLVKPDKKVDLTGLAEKESPDYTEEEIKEKWIPKSVEKLREWQLRLHAEEKKGILVVLQAIDAAGKDEIITFIFSHLMPQGLEVNPVKKPTEEDMKHDFLWRVHKGMPERGQIAILNRSYYEDLISPLVYGEDQTIPLPSNEYGEDPWEIRCRQVNDYERYMKESGFPVVKFFLNVSKEKQRKRLLERMKNSDKNWEFSFSDIEDRRKWSDFQEAYEKILNQTSTEYAPWYVLPADNGWYTRYIAAEIMIHVLEELNPELPVMTDEDKEKLDKEIQKLEKENEN
ncbi:polyphosphate--nucleotide phosphotransferase [Desemzia sp. RIT804]|uniref:PPK2 family polyphosphate kinase n=1 Tax=Desemzia sp. RIT 804 TaxID=2810209 RepID=UPI00194FE519|nr:PPK2 family polyphosphate kinase [Desemzia sp. RIT 804]MBM6614748.1 polyphosphate--nucleotide phosphotransferase [Desemzia sp. RIT 804]